MKMTTLKKRVLGCVGFSIITHFCVIAAAFILPGFSSQGTQKAQAPVSAPTAVITDSTAAPVEIIAAQDEAPPVAAAVAPAAAVEPVPAVVSALAPAPAPVKKHAMKFATSLPEKGERNANLIKETADDADANLKKALMQSRSEGDVNVSVVAQNNMPEQLQPDATFPEEGQTAVIAPVAQAAPQAAPAAPAATVIAPIQKTSASLGSTAPNPGAIRNGDDLKEIAGNIKPVYPAVDRRSGRQGTVVFVARLTPDGQVMNIRLEKSSGSPSIDSAAYSAFRSYRYRNGQQGLLRKAFTFALKGEPVEAPVARR